MNRRQRTGLAFGLLLILLGAWFLAAQLVPGLQEWARVEISWPLILVAVGVFLLLLGLLVGAPGMAVPACIVGGIGGLLYWQNLTGNWESWAYAWTLIPGFIGLGTILAALLGEGGRGTAANGFWMILTSLILFAIFGSLFGGLEVFGPYWPALLIVLGVAMLVRALVRRRA
jgi:hypothetical protein